MIEPDAPRGRRTRSGRHRRPHPVGRLVGAVGSIAVAVAAVAVARAAGAHDGRVNALGLIPAPPAAESSPSPSSVAEDHAPQWGAFARARGVRLYLPASRIVAVTYHEASFHNALTLHPLGHVVRNANRYKFDAPSRSDGPDYMVMSSRGRDTPATSAADVVLKADTPVRSPVTGRVVSVDEYHLYCRYQDFRIAVRPDGGTDLLVVMIHVRGIRVQPGDRVFATLSVIGYPRQFPFRSQVDDYVRGGNPHVHIEIAKPHKARLTAC